MVTHERDLSGYADRQLTLADGRVASDAAVTA
jgi:putative ABC transport system ATP-binding protein